MNELDKELEDEYRKELGKRIKKLDRKRLEVRELLDEIETRASTTVALDLHEEVLENLDVSERIKDAMLKAIENHRKMLELKEMKEAKEKGGDWDRALGG